jgi:hypothetical protein
VLDFLSLYNGEVDLDTSGKTLLFMADEFEDALEVEILAAALRMDKQESLDLLEYLAMKLTQALPDNTTVRRAGWPLVGKKPIEELTVSFEDGKYQLLRQKHGPIACRYMKVVRGVVLKTSDIAMDVWTNEVARQLSALAQANQATRQALNKMVTG